MRPVVVLLAAVAIDVTIGEWPNAVHPVAWIGSFHHLLRRYAPRSPAPAFLYGTFMAIAGPAVFGGIPALVLHALGRHPVIQFVVAACLLKSAFAIRALAAAGRSASRALKREDAPASRDALRSLVSRDTSALSRPLLAAAAIESVAENTSDSVVAPILFFLVGGVPAALAYRAANTLDAMIGYHGETEWLGKTAARLDDLLNLLPARLTALLLTVSAPLCGLSAPGALRVWWRDASRTESPNAGRPMSAMAGALGVELEKLGHYRLGAGGRKPDASDVDRSVALLIAASVVFLALASGTLLLHAPFATT